MRGFWLGGFAYGAEAPEILRAKDPETNSTRPLILPESSGRRLPSSQRRNDSHQVSRTVIRVIARP